MFVERVDGGEVSELGVLLLVGEASQDFEEGGVAGDVFVAVECRLDCGVVRVLILQVVVDGVGICVVPGSGLENAIKDCRPNSVVDAVKLLLRGRELLRGGVLCRRLNKGWAVEIAGEIDEVRIQCSRGVDLRVLVA